MRALLICLVLLTMVSGCARPLPPQDVADRFWRAVMTQHPAKIRRYVRAQDQETLKDDPEIMPVASFELRRVIIEDDEAIIETHITLAADKPVALKIDTVLVREKEQWRVDYSDTVENISLESNLAQVIGQIEAFGGTLKEGIDKSVAEMKKVLPDIEREISRIEEEIKQRVPELRERLEEFTRELENSLKTPPDAPQDAAPPDTIAI
jgi:hypothetical protein